MGIMDLFKTQAQPQPGPQPAPNPNANLPGVDANALVPNANTPTPDGSNPAFPAVKSPFDEYKDLWSAPKEGDLNGIPSSVPTFALDPTKLQAVAAGLDFTSQLSSEKITAAFGKDTPEIREVLNSIGQQGFVQNFSAGAKTVESAMKKNTEDLTTKTIPEMLRRQNISELNQSSDKLFSDPATAPMLKMLSDQFANKNPTATPQEIRDHTIKYFDSVVAARVGNSGKMISDAPKQNTRGETNWEDWVN